MNFLNSLAVVIKHFFSSFGKKESYPPNLEMRDVTPVKVVTPEVLEPEPPRRVLEFGGWMSRARGEIGIDENKNETRVIVYHDSTKLSANDGGTPWCSSFANFIMLWWLFTMDATWVVAKLRSAGIKEAAIKNMLKVFGCDDIDNLPVTIVPLEDAKIMPPLNAWARSWLNWGVRLEKPVYGCIAVFSRGQDSGHVGFYVTEDLLTITVLGGNQDNKVCYKKYPKSRLLGYRAPVGVALPAPQGA